MRLTLPAALLPLALSCEQAPKNEPVDSFTMAVEARDGAPTETTTGPVVKLVAPASVAAGVKIPIRILVTNETATPMDLYLRGRDIAFDLVVSDSTGDTVWRRLEGEVVPAILQLKTLAPGETLELKHDWDQRAQTGTPVQPGAYGVRGTVLTDGQRSLVSAREIVIIRPQ